ncbi:MAG: hypothetical protein K6F09_03160 [Clostridiales bacterium]|nr:hypothetical protein [Clostridiales bacterium]
MVKLPVIRSVKELSDLVNEIGFLPFFSNQICGFSLEDIVDRRYWFPASGDGVWEWKTPVIETADCAYGKFFKGKAGFISREMYPDFANYRRDGYDFDALYDEGLARRTDKAVFDVIYEEGSVSSKELKYRGNFRKGGNTGFDGIVTRLQMQGYILVRAFDYQRDKFGNEYGWGLARYETPEKRFGDHFTDNVYKRQPGESFELISERLSRSLKIGIEEVKKFIK